MKPRAAVRRRDFPLVWGFVAVFCLGSVLFVWLNSPAAADLAVFGARGSVAVVAAALLGTVVGTVAALVSSGTSRRLRLGGVGRWTVALPLAVVAGAVAVLAGGSLLAPQHSADFLTGVLLAAGAVGTSALATQVARCRVAPTNHAGGNRAEVA